LLVVEVELHVMVVVEHHEKEVVVEEELQEQEVVEVVEELQEQEGQEEQEEQEGRHLQDVVGEVGGHVNGIQLQVRRFLRLDHEEREMWKFLFLNRHLQRRMC